MNYETIREYVEAGLTSAQIVTELQAVTVEVPNTTAWTIGAIESATDAATAETIAGVVKAAGDSNPLMASAFVALSTVGLQLHTPARQALIEQIGQAAGMTAEQVALVKELGLTITHPYAEVTEQEVTDCIADYNREQMRMTTWQAWQDVYNAHVSPVLDGAEPTVANLIAGLQAAIAELEG